MRELISTNDRRPLWGTPSELDNLFEGFFSPRRAVQSIDSDTFVPAVDVSETDNEYRVKAEMPGVKKEDLSVNVQDGVLTISAETKYEDEEKKEGRVIRQERHYGKYSRAMRLGKDVDASGVKAEYKDGILELTLPKLEEVKPKKIAISVN